MEVGSRATPFEHRSYGTELALCQRYFFTQSGTGSTYKGFTFRSTATTERGLNIFFPQEMRITPTVDVTVQSSTLANVFPNKTAISVRLTATATDSASSAVTSFTADAEL